MKYIKDYQIECDIERKYLKAQQSIAELKTSIFDKFKIEAILNYLIKIINKY